MCHHESRAAEDDGHQRAEVVVVVILVHLVKDLDLGLRELPLLLIGEVRSDNRPMILCRPALEVDEDTQIPMAVERIRMHTAKTTKALLH